MGLRDNFRQAARELMDGPEAARSRSYEPAPPAPAPAFVPEPPPAPEPEPAAAAETGGIQPQDVTQALNELESFMNSYNSTQSAQPSQPAPSDSWSFESSRPSEPTTIIAAGTVIRGSVESDTNRELYGEVQGDIMTTKDLKLKGKIQGNATAGNVELCSIHMVGNVTATGTAVLDAESEVEGDVVAESIILNGKIRGNVQVSKRLSLEGSAVICGRVSAEKLSVDEGAVIQGEILIGKSMMPPKPAAPARPAAPVRPPVAPVQRPVGARPVAAPKPPVGAAPKAPAAPRPAAAKPAAKPEETAGEEKKED